MAENGDQPLTPAQSEPTPAVPFWRAGESDCVLFLQVWVKDSPGSFLLSSCTRCVLLIGLLLWGMLLSGSQGSQSFQQREIDGNVLSSHVNSR